jgi:hypothetical protein
MGGYLFTNLNWHFFNFLDLLNLDFFFHQDFLTEFGLWLFLALIYITDIIKNFRLVLDTNFWVELELTFCIAINKLSHSWL